MKTRHVLLLILTMTLAACNEVKRVEIVYDNDSTLQPLAGHKTPLGKESRIEVDIDKLIEVYQTVFDNTEDPALRKEVMLRLADLEMEKQEEYGLNMKNRGKAATPDYSKVIALYQRFVQTYPNFTDNDHILYQLAKAYELNGDLENTLLTLQNLVTSYPATPYLLEAQFRLGELFFVMTAYADAAEAYQVVIHKGKDTQYYEKALYKQGWALYKKGAAEQALDSLIVLLDQHLAGIGDLALQDSLQKLSRGDQELVNDTLRVISLIFSASNDNTAPVNYFAAKGRRDYEHLIYQHLGEFYLAQERIKDAADTFLAFAGQHQQHRQSPFFELRVIDVYRKGNFKSLLFAAKKDFVTHYHLGSDYWLHADPGMKTEILPQVKTHLSELTRYFHATAQRTTLRDDYLVAANWYRIFLESFPDDSEAAAKNFLLAELLFENRQYAEAVSEYEKTAYDYSPHEKSAEAAYSALLAYREHEKDLGEDEKTAWHRQSISSALRFTEHFLHHPNTPMVLAKAATELFELNETDAALNVAQRIIDTAPESQHAHRRTAWTVIAHAAFDQQDFARAELAYSEVIKLTPATDPDLNKLQERLAATIYKQGEAARAQKDMQTAATHFLRVGKIVPNTTIRSTADYDAAAAYIVLKDWPHAIEVLESFRHLYPGHTLQIEITTKLAVAYLEDNRFEEAAVELETISHFEGAPEMQRDALLQSAGLREKTGKLKEAIESYKDYISRFPTPLEQAIDIRLRIAGLYEQQKDNAKQRFWLKQIISEDKSAGAQRTDLTRYLAAKAALTLAEQDYRYYASIPLKEPLKTSLKKKKKAMEATLDAYTRTLNYEVAETTTAATYQIARIYSDFSKALMSSERPKKLSKEELEQYNLLLEEQAYPFEDKAIEAHQLNAQRVISGIYDQWIKKSFSDLAAIFPARYGKTERNEVFIGVLE